MKGTTLGWVKKALKGELDQPKRTTVPKGQPKSVRPSPKGRGK